MQFIRFLAFLLFLFVKILPSQGQTVVKTEQIKWISGFKIFDPAAEKKIPVFYFENAVFNDSRSWLPFYQGRRKINPGENATVEFQQTFFEEVPPAELVYMTNLSDISDSVIISVNTASEQKELYLVYSFIPLRRNIHSGKIERLKYFSLKISGTPGMKLKSASLAGYAAQSVFQSGDWFKFFVNKSGIYKISYADLKKIGITDPRDVRIYGNGGKKLPEVFTRITQDDPGEIPVLLVTGSDGVFNEGDYLLFYAEGPVTYTYDKNTGKYSQQKNPFNDKVSYFLTSKPGGKKIQVIQEPSENATFQVSSGDALDYHEENSLNLLRSGQAWYGEEFNTISSYNFNFSFPARIVSEPVKIRSEVAGRSGYENFFSFSQNNQAIGSVRVPAVFMDNSLSTYANTAAFESDFTAPSKDISLKISFNKNGDLNGSGWLDYISLVARQNLVFGRSQFAFRDSRSVGSGSVARFTISNASAGLKVWDVSDINNVTQLAGNIQNNTLSFKAKTDELHEYVVVDEKGEFPSPEFISVNNGRVDNQNLHALSQPDMIIVTHPMFMQQAKELADLHLQRDNLKSVVVTPGQIFNEFSSGMQDPAAIRNFVKMFYDRGSSRSDRPKYLLLFGDGSYDNRSSFTEGSQNTNFIITYESINSLHPTSTFVSDDYFGLLDENEAVVSNPGSTSPNTYALLDIGIGRLPVNDTEEAKTVVAKIKKYYDHRSFGDWRNRISFIGDDEDENIHMIQADELAGYAKNNIPSINIEKIYLDAYQQVSSSTGQRYPEVNKAIQNQLNRGLLILNYTGHGGERGLAHEQIMRQNEDIKLWKNDVYPLFITATCEFSRFDSYTETTAGEDVLLNPSGGGVALLTTNRLVYSAPNFVLNQQFYKQAFTKTEENPAYRLGDIIRKTKNNAGSDINKLNFALLGDPALPLAFPKLLVVTDSINAKPVSETDTLRSYSKVFIKGHIEEPNGIKAAGFNGIVIPILFDKTRKVTTLANDGGTPFEFNLQNKVLFKGKASVRNGEFSINFQMPRDMDYSFGNGRISYYALDSTTDAAGYFNSVTVGGLSLSGTQDESGPEIRLFMNDTTFRDGGITNEYPTLLAKVCDENGINPGGNSIGHDIITVLDEDNKQSFVLNDFYESDLNNPKSGTVTFRFSQITPGEHVLTFKVWDIFNNSSQKTLKFKVLKENNLTIQNVLNYPNPLADYTNFYFEHNQPSEDLEVNIEIYDLAGKKIKDIKTFVSGSGFTSGPIYWDATDETGNRLPAGIYIYRIRVNSGKETVFSSAKKIIVTKT